MKRDQDTFNLHEYKYVGQTTAPERTGTYKINQQRLYCLLMVIISSCPFKVVYSE